MILLTYLFKMLSIVDSDKNLGIKFTKCGIKMQGVFMGSRSSEVYVENWVNRNIVKLANKSTDNYIFNSMLINDLKNGR